MVKKIISHKIIWPVLALIGIMLFNLIFTPGFLTIEIKNGRLFGSIIDILKHASPLIIMSIGMTLVIATEGIDISVGAVVAISAAVACSAIVAGNSLFVAILYAMIASAICGLWNGVLVAKIGIQPMVGTLILMTIGRGIAQLITKGQIITVDHEGYYFIGNGYLFGLPFGVYIAIAVTVLVYIALRKTSLGLFLESVGTNKEASRFAGINASNIILITYVICGLFAGIAGIFISSNVTAADANNAGMWKEIDAILATVIGGTSMTGGRIYLMGTVLGALFIQTLTTTIYSTGVPPETILVVKAVVVILVTLMQSNKFRNKTAKLFHRKAVV
ncbi:MAG: ABC transporter permease [Vallitaleaceae bacterium]|jgi:ribose/xylose/arabinose/galactoside ABC-type transport system permease subunit|nr:ABC transporter permease [Vallitaleaceae bacterium]